MVNLFRGVCIKRTDTPPVSGSRPFSPEGDPMGGGPLPPSLSFLHGIGVPLLESLAPSFPAHRQGSGIYGVLAALTQSCRRGATSLWISTRCAVSLWAAAWGWTNASLQNIGPPGFFSSGDAEGTANASIGSGNASVGRRHRERTI